ncbi:hypothetical protein HYPSUDRAFT_46258 [Hypholoma sublateritium FD-334 SS-4]|uniref:Uncharacterized protein n=1 Tax=Hypholoma sublateritium (strain FD-334 SS-4) TaxID=945553 RepID=A0A0D2PBE6_HYPSF|nr:hypothetical protein HYPSUDRAFT_46258 [Hypholoma sublateritium FD-334 SS-4]
MATPAVPTSQTIPNDLDARWQQLRDAAKKEGTVLSVSDTLTVTPRTLLGTYFAVWDDHTDMEAYDSDTQEVSYLDLALENPGEAAARHKHSAMEAEDSGIENNEKKGTEQAMSTQKVPATVDGDVAFADIWGRFRWWRMLGQFKGLYRPPGAPENVWYFGDVAWTPLGHEPDDSDDEAEMWEGEAVDADTRDTHDFGLAVLGTLDRRGRPFVEMLYNGTGYYTEERRKRARGKAEEEKAVAVEGREYARILWKKQDEAWSRDPIGISGRERVALRRDAGMTTLEPGYGVSDDDDEGDIKAGVKRDAEDDSDAESEVTDEKKVKRVKTAF